MEGGYACGGVLTVLHSVSRAEEKKRLQASANYAAVGFTYDQRAEQPVEPYPLPVAGPTQREHPPTSSVDIASEDDGDVFVPPAGLTIPESIQVVRVVRARQLGGS